MRKNMAKRTLVNLHPFGAKEILAFKKALEKYYKENKDECKLKIRPVDDITLEIGIGLIPLAFVEEIKFVDRIRNIRQEIGRLYGILIPLVRIADNALLDKYEYRIKIKGEEFGKYKLKYNKFIAIENSAVKNKIDGKIIKEPVFGTPAILITRNQVESASEAGYTIADAPTVILTHIENILKNNLDKIFSYQNSKDILKELKTITPGLVEDILQNIKIIDLKYILMKLLSKQVSLTNIEKILELVLKNIKKNNDDIIEYIKFIYAKNFYKNL
jgi:flagellar biosynthesis protein FlhA